MKKIATVLRWIATLTLALSLFGCADERGDMTVESQTADTKTLTRAAANRFANLALSCIHKEYPNKLNQVLPDGDYLRPPSELHPAFYGCFDWHSSVHGHWMLVKLLKTFPDIETREAIVAGLETSISADNIAKEVAYFDHESASWERTYGWAWLLQLAAELQTWADEPGPTLAQHLDPLTRLIRDRYIEFLPRQEYPVRTGVHPNTAFGLAFALDYADIAGDGELKRAVVDAATRYYADDTNCPLSWEPSGEDFLSPCFEEAALMSRVLDRPAFRDWLAAFLPELFEGGDLVPANVSDRSDPKIVHLDGLNLSRAWDLKIIAAALDDDSQRARLRGWAEDHLNASLPHVASEHYEGSHWLGSFAVYALTRDR